MQGTVCKVWSVENEGYGKMQRVEIRSVEKVDNGKGKLWKIRNMKDTGCGKCRVKTGSGEKAQYGKCGVWKMPSVDSAKYMYGKCGVWKTWSV